MSEQLSETAPYTLLSNPEISLNLPSLPITSLLEVQTRLLDHMELLSRDVAVVEAEIGAKMEAIRS